MRAALADAPDSPSDLAARPEPSCRGRLTRPGEFAAVLRGGRVFRGKHLAINVLPSTLTTARLGLAVSKRAARRAVDRNYMKRVLRVLFGRHVPALVGLDVVVSVRQAFVPGSFPAISSEFEGHVREVQRWRASSSA